VEIRCVPAARQTVAAGKFAGFVDAITSINPVVNRSKIKAVLCLCSVAVLLAAGNCFSADITTLDGKTYKDATVTGVEPDALHISFRQGVVRIPFVELPNDLRRQYGYDPLKAAQYQNPVAVKPAGRVLADNPEQIRMFVVLGGVALILLVVVLVIYSNAKSRAAKEALYEKLTNELHDYTEAAKQANKLPTVSTDVFLKAGESAFYDCPSSLYETRAVRQYQAGHVGFRVAKGVWVGGTQGQSVSNQEWSKIDDGTLTITNIRMIFNGTQGSRNIVLNKIISVQSFLDGLEVAVENRQKNLMLTAPNPYIAAGIIRVLHEGGGLGEAAVQTKP